MRTVEEEPMNRLFIPVLSLCCLAVMAPANAQGQVTEHLRSPPPGSVYREYWRAMSTNNNDWRVTDPNATYKDLLWPENPNQPAGFLPNSSLTMTVGDLAGATRAEAMISLWGGHVGTTGKKLRFNSNSWITIPELATTPAAGQCYLSQWNVVVDVPLEHLITGTNRFEGTSGNQTCFGWNWGQWGWYMLTLRVYYDPATKPHPTGAITSPAPEAIFGENPTVTASASGPNPVSSVEFYAYYDGYDSDGDGVYQQYHHHYHRAAGNMWLYPQSHVGTVSAAPYATTWDTSLVPDQDLESIKLIARIKDTTGLIYVTDEVDRLTLHRVGASVKLYKPVNVPQNYLVRTGLTRSSGVEIPSGTSLASAVSAKLMLRTWNGIDGMAELGEEHTLKVNSYTVPNNHYGKNHYFSLDVVNLPPSALSTGYNTISFFSQSSHHGIDVLWPGPGVLVRYEYPVPPPEIPQGITGDPLSDTQVELSWLPNTEFELAGYDVHRSTDIAFVPNAANKVASMLTQTEFMDSGRVEATTYYYKVLAVNTFGTRSLPSGPAEVTTLYDVTAAEIVSVTPLSYEQLRVTFNDPVDPVTAEQVGRYGIFHDGGEVLIAFAQLQGDGRTVLLTSYPMSDGVQYTLEVVGVLDRAIHPNACDDAADFTLNFELMAHWKLDEGAGNTAQDSVGGRVGTLVGPAWTSSPNSPAALFFDGSNDRLDLGGLDVPGNAMTIALWFRADSFTVQDGRLFSKATGLNDNDHYIMLSPINMTGSMRLRFRLRAGGTVTTLFANSGNLKLATWSHVAAVYDGVTMKIIKDGVQVGSLAKTGAINVNSAILASVGNQPAGAGARPFHGAIDDVRIYNRALTLSEVQNLMSASSQCLPPLIMQQPQGSVACSGTPLTLSMSLMGSGPFQFQWFKNGVAVPGATSASLTLSNPAAADAGAYHATITNACGAATSQTVDIAIRTPAAITSQPASVSLCEGGPVSFAATATGSPPLSYQWRRNGQPIAGATSTSHAIAAAQGAHAGSYDCVVTNECGSVTSSAALLVVHLDPTVAVPPASQNACQGSALTLSVTAAGTAPFGYQWRRNGVELPGEIGAQLPLTNVQQAQAGSYDCVITNQCNTVTSPAATVTVLPLPQIVTQSASQTVCEGLSVQLSVTATGAEPLSYQWKKDGVALPGATASVFSIGAMSFQHAGSYTVTVSNGCQSIQGSAIQLTLRTAPAITQQPVGGHRCDGEAITLSVTAGGSAPLSYQWRRDGQPVTGATSASLVLDPARPAHSGEYTVVVTNSCGVITSAAAPVVVSALPGFTTQPVGRTVCQGDTVTFTMVATGTEPLAYQWRVNGVPIPGAIANSYSMNGVTTALAGNYDVVVTNPCGVATSATATLNVRRAPLIVQQPESVQACAGSPTQLSVLVNGSTPLNYQWRRNGVDIPGAIGAALNLASPGAADAGVYEVTISNTCGSVISSPATLALNQPPAFTVQPPSQGTCNGEAVTLSAVATGTAPLSYQWKLNGVSIPGATTSSYTIASLTSLNAGIYTLQVTNTCGSVLSQGATVEVIGTPLIIQQPANLSGCPGMPATFAVTALGPSPLIYQWFRNGEAIAGATAETFTIASVTAVHAGQYSVEVRHNPCGAVQSAAAVLDVKAPPQIVSQPVTASACENFALELSVAATGTGPLSYQWRRNDVNLPGATGPVLSIAAAQLDQAGQYTVVVMNDCGFVVSGASELVVLPGLICDCNGNGLLDGDDLASGFASDCNGNGVPDSCDIALGVSLDTDGDTIPDECAPEAFIRGDCTADGRFNLADAVTLLNFLFTSGAPLSCADACDHSDDGVLNLADVIGILCSQFCDPAPPPAAPYPACGLDTTPDLLDCQSYSCP